MPTVMPAEEVPPLLAELNWAGVIRPLCHVAGGLVPDVKTYAAQEVHPAETVPTPPSPRPL